MSATSRQRVLQRLRSAAPAQVPPVPDAAPFFQNFRPEQPLDERILRFRAAAEAWHADVLLTTEEDWPECLRAECESRNINSLLHGAGIPQAARLAQWGERGPHCVAFDFAMQDHKPVVFDHIDAGLSFARGGIADTGTLILWTGADEPRTQSLVPHVSFALLDARHIHASLFAAMQGERWGDGLPTNVVLVSGPSKTADIQQVLAYGAHGPRALVVLLVMPQGTGSAEGAA